MRLSVVPARQPTVAEQVQMQVSGEGVVEFFDTFSPREPGHPFNLNKNNAFSTWRNNCLANGGVVSRAIPGDWDGGK